MYRKSDLTKAYYKTGEVASFLGITPRAVQLKDMRGELPFEHTDTGRRILSRDSLLAYLDKCNMLYDDEEAGRRDLVYARVSSQDQKSHGDLDRQALFLVEHEGKDMRNPLILEECGSGMDARRPKLQQLIKMVMRNEIRNVYVTHEDRLARFGFEYLETAFAEHGTNIIAVRDESQDKAVQEELVEDMMSLIASFSGKLYGLRSRRDRKGDGQ